MRRAGFVVILWLCSAIAFAHVTVWPRESAAGAHEKYVVRVPTEGKVATESVQLRIPAGVEIVSIGAPNGFRYEVKRTDGTVTGIVWSMAINPGEFAEFAFMARNPKQSVELRWEAIQRYTDGTTTEWLGPASDRHPASVTQVTVAAGGHTH